MSDESLNCEQSEIAGCVTARNDAAAGCDQALPTPTDRLPESSQTKTRPATLREFERALCTHLGYSRREAAALARDGYKGLMPPPELTPDEVDRIRALLERNANLFRS